MTFWTLIRRSLRFHARAHVGVVLGAAVGSAVLIGALLVGDSVRESLRERALRGLGPIHFAISSGDRLFDQRLQRLPLLQANNIGLGLVLPGVASRQDSAARANHVTVIGMDRVWEGNFQRLWQSSQTALVNQSLARQLGINEGDEIVLRVRKPTALALDAALSPREQDTVALRLKVSQILKPEPLGDFSLSPPAQPPANLFLSLDFLAQRVGVPDKANLLLFGESRGTRTMGRWEMQRARVAAWLWRRAVLSSRGAANQTAKGYWSLNTNLLSARLARALEPQLRKSVPDELTLRRLRAQLDRAWLPEYSGLDVHALELPESATGAEYIGPAVELTSSRIFLEPSVVAAALTPRTALLTSHVGNENDNSAAVSFSAFVTNGVPVLTYLANLIRAGNEATPYSFVTAAGGSYVPKDMRDDEIVVNEWLADDLKIKVGDDVQLSYYVVDSGSHLIERTNSFRVRAVVPLRGVYGDRTLMPEFPGIAKAETAHDWDAGFPLVYRIRPKDEAYWKQYRGTPKAFVTLKAGQAMWANRFGSLTAIRYSVPTNSFASTYRDAVYKNLLANLSPADMGLRIEPVRAQALRAATQSQDFGQLFLGFSFFLIVAALLLMALLFQFGLEQRASEVGTLLALGFTVRQVRRLLLLEGIALALVGGLIGAPAGTAYARAMLEGLRTVWRSAVGAGDLQFHATTSSILIGVFASTLIAAVTLWLALRSQVRRTPAELLAGVAVQSAGRLRRRRRLSGALWLAASALTAALLIVGWALARREAANAEAFFSAGALLLLSGLAFASIWFRRIEQGTQTAELNLRSLGVRGCARRGKRSVATLALLACGAFLIAAIGAFRLDANREVARRSSGTGGFALIGDSTLPVVHDLNTPSGRESVGLAGTQSAAVSFVAFKVHAGDEASCLNLNRAQQPRLLGVKPEQLSGRFTFVSAAPGLDRRQGWQLLRSMPSSSESSAVRTPHSALDEIPAVGDANSIQWALGKKVGDTLDYVDERGRAFKVRLAGAVANSILQGSLIIDEAEFVKRFPGEGGYRYFLVDAPSNSLAEVSATLSRALQDAGMELTPAVQRLNEFNAVQNTYLGTFQILGGLGLLLGSAGLGIVVLRNVLERRGELAVLLAVGFRRRALEWLVLIEHGALLVLGLSLGILTAALAILPALLTPGRPLPVGSLALTLAGVLLNGALWTWLATRYALRGNLLEALRNE